MKKFITIIFTVIVLATSAKPQDLLTVFTEPYLSGSVARIT
ncbi:MAG TPA: hypothetical protein PLC51_06370 [Candidatus Marinimicrobia bacterium]|jgi:hypothetical protein|nr:hypothetical protein [Candidatus Neomarinimicrobiota bacterium]HPY00876.1 hypothetical protein [Candidatus Neomarinimicrobiota bacterium]HQC62666.1 hypothetical protein [Candidatus Neomarinimicrobiota bacterium]